MVKASQPASSRIWPDVPEARAHHFGLVTELLVVSVNLLDRLHAGIFRAGVIAFVSRFIPIVNAAHERRDQLNFRLRTTHRLRERKEQRQIAFDSFLLQLLRRSDPFPGRGDFDQHALRFDPPLFVKLDQLARLRHRPFRVERITRIGFGRDAARNDLQNLAPKLDQQMLDDVFDLSRAAQAGASFGRRSLHRGDGRYCSFCVAA